MVSRALALAVASAVLAAGACTSGDDGPPVDIDGTVGGRVLVTLDGPLVGAQVAIDHLEYLGATPMVRSHIGDRVTDDTGHFEHPTGTASGYFLITARGGAFTDYATGERVVLDPADELTALLYTDSLEDLTTGLVTPITHLAHRLIVARTTAGIDRSLVDSHTLVNAHLDQHFGGVHWERVAPASLAVAAQSPTDEVRAAFVLAAWSLVARDIASAAGTSVQEVNPFTLALDLGRDLATGPFDGDDGNDRTSGTGIQLGACPAPDPSCVPDGTCTLGACRSPCDAYAGTPRTTLAAAVTFLINDTGPGGRNQTGLDAADALSFARAMAMNVDPILFGDACIDELDRVAPRLTWGAMPTDGAIVRGSVTWTVHAEDNVDPAPVVTWAGGLPDSDGTPDGAATTIDTAAVSDRDHTVTATAIDATGNAVTESRTVTADNTAPVLTVAPAGYLVDGATWWTTQDAPHLTGMVSDLHGPITIEARILGALVASTTIASGAWELALPAGSVAPAGSVVVLRAVDAVGNATVDAGPTSPTLRVDSIGPSVESLARTFIDEGQDIITYAASPPPPFHQHSTNPAYVTTLGGTAAPPTCPTVRKYAYRTAQTPPGSETTANPIALAFRASDVGIGLDASGASFTVQAPSGPLHGPYPIVSVPAIGAPGAYDSLATLVRDTLPPIGAPSQVEEGVFTVTFTARDRLGQTATLARCFTYQPLGPPLQVVTGPREAVAGSFVRTLRADYALPNGATSALLNGTATAGVLELWVKNSTPDPAYVTVTAPPPPAATFVKQIVTYLEPTTQQTVTGPTCDVLNTPPTDDPLCTGDSPTPLGPVNASGSIAGWTPSIGLFEVNAIGTAIAGPEPVCPGCAADQRLVEPGTQMAIVVGAAGIAELAPDVPGPYREISGDFTGAVAPGAPTVRRCITWSPVNGAGFRNCTRVQNFRQNRTLQSYGVTLAQGGPAGVPLEARWFSRVRPAFAAAAPSEPAILVGLRGLPAAFTCSTTEN